MQEFKVVFRLTNEEYHKVVRGHDEMAMLEIIGRAFEDGDYSPMLPSTKDRLDQQFTVVYRLEGKLTHKRIWAVSKHECLEHILIKATDNPKAYNMSEIDRIAKREYHELTPEESYIKYNCVEA